MSCPASSSPSLAPRFLFSYLIFSPYLLSLPSFCFPPLSPTFFSNPFFPCLLPPFLHYLLLSFLSFIFPSLFPHVLFTSVFIYFLLFLISSPTSSFSIFPINHFFSLLHQNLCVKVTDVVSSLLLLQAFGFLATAMFLCDVVFFIKTYGLPWKKGGKPETSNGGLPSSPDEAEKLNRESNSAE